jgi:hypothetical protein
MMRFGALKPITVVCALAAAATLVAPSPAWAWGPVTHVAFGLQTLATIISRSHPLYATLAACPEIFLYGSLAPDIVQGRRLQSRLRRHSHNWATGFSLLQAATDAAAQTFALGYLAHLAADVVAHNFYLPLCYIGRYDARLSGHIYFEACFDAAHERSYQDVLLKLLAVDFTSFDALLKKALDSHLVPFAMHRRLFEGGLKRIQQFNRIVNALGGAPTLDAQAVQTLCDASRAAIGEIIEGTEAASVCQFDPMGQQSLRSAATTRVKLRRLTRARGKAAQDVRELADSMHQELCRHIAELPFFLGQSARFKRQG